MAHGVNMFDGAVWMNSPAIHLEIRSFADFALDGRHRPVSVVRMDAPHPVIPRRHSRCGIEAKQAVVFFGRMDDTSARDVECPAAGVAHPLRVRQISLAPSQGLFGALAAFNLGCRSVPSTTFPSSSRSGAP